MQKQCTMKRANIFIVLYVLTLVFQGQDAYQNLVIPNVTKATQSSTWKTYVANRAVDGQPWKLRMDEGSCSHTADGEDTAWLQIQLDKVYNVKEVKFWYRNDRRTELRDTSRLHYYSMYYVDPTGNKLIRCYKDQTPYNETIPMPSTVSCKGETASIQFYNRHPTHDDDSEVYLEICEVEIYGCGKNRYGENCSSCSDKCSKCDVVNGCVSCSEHFTGNECQLCQPGYTEGDCGSSCKVGWYGQNCSMECSTHCNNSSCNPVNGTCPWGCSPGYRGSMCNEECPIGTYGFWCNQTCDNCLDKKCNAISGVCESGCNDGWIGNKCDQDGRSTGPSLIEIAIGMATTALCISCFLVIFVICYHKRRVSGIGNVTQNPYEGPSSADVPTANVFNLPVKIQTENSMYDELAFEDEYQN